MIVDKELCFRCAACVSTCRKGSIVVTEFDIHVLETCNNCGVCERICPMKAITIEKANQA